MKIQHIIWLGVIFFVHACGQQQQESSSLSGIIGYSEQDALRDFDTAVQHYKESYAPYEYKAEHIIAEFDFDSHAAVLRDQLASAAMTKAEITTALDGTEYGRRTVTDANNKIEGIFKNLTAYFQDGHVQVSLPKHPGQLLRKKLGLAVLPFRNTEGDWDTVVVNVAEDFTGNIKKGDIILSIDGKNPMDYLPLIKRYEHDGDATSMAHLSHVFVRDAYMTDLLEQTAEEVVIEWQPAGGGERETKSASFLWKQEFAETYTKSYLPVSPSGVARRPTTQSIEEVFGKQSGFNRGQETPFFFTSQVEDYLTGEAAAGVDLRRTPATSTLERFGITNSTFKPVFAFRYNLEDKTILLIRQPTYFTDAMIAAYEKGDWSEILKISGQHIASYKAVLYENRDADVLVIDQTYNPGGATNYAIDFYRIFLTEEKHSLVSFNSADQANYEGILKEYKEEKDAKIREIILQNLAEFEQAWTEGRKLTKAQPLGSHFFTAKPYTDMRHENGGAYYWTKPILVLTNAQSGSSGDIFPHLMAQNGVAEIFGERTGGWGGNVEDYNLSHTRGKFRVTRSLFVNFNGTKDFSKYNPGVLVENNGQPVSDQAYDRPLTTEDFRAGFLQYFKDFSAAAAKL